MGVAMPFFSGAGGSSSSMPMNPIPRRSPVVTVVGDPIKLTQIENPTTEDINNARILYVQKLQEIFNEFADKYAPERKSNLEIVK
jgi:2-acylglycerol O-acyltransferase 2